MQARVEPSQGLFLDICEGTRELHLEATQVPGIASKHPGNPDRNPVRRTSQTIANVCYGSLAEHSDKPAPCPPRQVRANQPADVLNIQVACVPQAREALKALNRHRGKGQQKVTVEHVHVHAGGMVETQGRGDQTKSEDQPGQKFANQIANQLRGTERHWASQVGIIG